MTSCAPIQAQFDGRAEALFETVVELTHAQGGTIPGNEAGGSVALPVPVSGTVEVVYRISRRVGDIQVIKRSCFLACRTIEAVILHHASTEMPMPLAATWGSCRGDQGGYPAGADIPPGPGARRWLGSAPLKPRPAPEPGAPSG